MNDNETGQRKSYLRIGKTVIVEGDVAMAAFLVTVGAILLTLIVWLAS